MQNELTVNTVEWWLNQITDPIIKRLALGNMWDEARIEKSNGIIHAINFMCDWVVTKEGNDFWSYIYWQNDPNITFENVKHLLPENYTL